MVGSLSEPVGLTGPLSQHDQGHIHVYSQNVQSPGQLMSTDNSSSLSPRQTQQLRAQITAYYRCILCQPLSPQESMMASGIGPYDFNPDPPEHPSPHIPIRFAGFELPRIEVAGDLHPPNLQQQKQQQQEQAPSYKDISRMLLGSPCEVFEHVYLGTNKDANNLENLKKMGVRHFLGIDEDVKMDLYKRWDDAFEYISKAKKDDSKVLVHCETGSSCSAAVVIAYAMKAYDWDFSQALSHVKMRCSRIMPNRSLLLQLVKYQGVLEVGKNEKNRLQMLNRTDDHTYDIITFEDGSDDSIIELPLPKVSSVMPALKQQSSTVINQKREEFCRRSEKRSPRKSTVQESSSKQQLKMPQGGVQPGARSRIGLIYEEKEAQKNKVIKNSMRNGSHKAVEKPDKIKSGSQNMYKCSYKGCGKVYYRSSSFSSHKKTHEPTERVTCQGCQKNLYRVNLKMHRRRCTGGIKFECNRCKRKFVTRTSIVVHLKRCNSGNQKKYPCPYKGCDRVYDRSSSFYYHKQTHERITCEHCSRHFSRRGRLEEHVCCRNVYKKLECDHCQRAFANRRAIICHLLSCKQKNMIDEKDINKNVPPTPPK